MIQTEAEYQEACQRLSQESLRLAEHRVRLRAAGLRVDEIKRVIDPIESLQLGLHEEVAAYERLKR
jgi:hypothetical protein